MQSAALRAKASQTRSRLAEVSGLLARSPFALRHESAESKDSSVLQVLSGSPATTLQGRPAPAPYSLIGGTIKYQPSRVRVAALVAVPHAKNPRAPMVEIEEQSTPAHEMTISSE